MSPPEVAGPAYRVKPSISLAYTATVTYRHALPSDTSEVNIGRIDAAELAAGMGHWESLSDCRVNRGDRLVRCSDDELGAYYGLLDGLLGNTADSIADSGTGDATDTSVTTNPTTTATTNPTTTATTNTTDPTDTDPTDPTDPTGHDIDYPPECDSLMPGPFVATDHGQLFVTDDTMSPPLGSEDLAMDGHGGLVGRSGNTLRRYTLASPDPVLDASFTPPTFAGPSLGLRYAPSGDLVMMQRSNGRVEVMHPDYSVETAFSQQATSVPNGLFVDPDGIFWTTFYVTSRVMRFDPADTDPTVITMQAAPNGILYDPLRAILFYLFYSDGVSPSLVLRLPISDDGSPVGMPATVTEVDGYSDGLALDVCGNLYVVDQGGATNLIDPNTSRVDRVFMNDFGELDSVEEIIVLANAEISNLAWGDGAFATIAYMTGLRGHVFSTDLSITSAPTGSTMRSTR